MNKKFIEIVKSPYTYVYLFFAVFCFWLAYQVPYTHDDWDWGLQNGIEQLLYAKINSRYAGNFIEVIMTRSVVVKTILMGSIYLLIPYLLSAVASMAMNTDKKFRTLFFVLCNVLLLSMNRAIWQQTYGWIAGFSNFCVSVIFLIIWIRELELAFKKDISVPHTSVIKLLFWGVICVVFQLFLENIAIYSLIIACFVIAVYLKRNRKVPVKNIVMLAGAIIGLVIIFSSNIYGSLWSEGEAIDGYRRIIFINFGSVKELAYNFMIQISLIFQRALGANLITILLISALLTVFLFKNRSNPNKSRILFIAVNILFMLYFISYYIITKLYNISDKSASIEFVLDMIDTIVNALYFIAVIFEIIILFRKDKLYTAKLLSIWLSALLVVIPLIATSEIGFRLFFSSEVVLIYFSLTLLGALTQNTSSAATSKIIGGCLIICSMLIISHIIIYAQIGACAKAREKAIDNAIKNKAAYVILPKYPHKDYLWFPDPVGHRMEYFKEFYGIPEDMDVYFE